MSTRSIQTRVFLAVLGVAALLVIPLATYFPGQLIERERESLRHNATVLSRILAAEAGEALTEGRTLSIMRIQAIAAQYPEFEYAVLFDENGDIAAAHGLNAIFDISPGKLVGAADADAPQISITQPSEGEERVLEFEARQQLEVAVAVHHEDARRGYVIAGFETATIEARIASIRNNALQLGGLVLLVGALLAAAVGRLIRRDIRPLLHAAERVGAGEFDVRVAAPRTSELRQVAQAIDAMAIALEDAEAQRKRFFAGITHELRSPLNTISGFTELVEEKEDLSEQSRRNLGFIKKATARAAAMVNTILDFSKLQAKRLDAQPEPFDPRATLQEVADETRGLVGARPIDLHVDPGDLPSEITNDPARLTQILVNLTSNAVRFTQEGSITISARREGDTHVAFAVRDTGLGIPEHLQGELFEAFKQAPHTAGGTGLGLATVRLLAELLGGEVRVESEVGKGSEFTVTIAVALVASPQ